MQRYHKSNSLFFQEKRHQDLVVCIQLRAMKISCDKLIKVAKISKKKKNQVKNALRNGLFLFCPQGNYLD